MAIHIQSGKTKACHNTQLKIQYMPFKIAADSEANVSSYFDKYVKLKEDSNYNASFRGYPLTGKKIDIPDGYKGVILHERIKPVTDKDDRNFYVINEFNSFMYWNWDKVPSKNDPILQTIDDWFDIAEALHSPIIEQ
ncbi:hypothetical protein ILUMI_23590 [Ignelater luminosus]|uniref:Uncharacterized protein n=1 Tax=Ignelater luminosus TaxID=2038154 RepID=A0A8K0CDK9_IGNLU|nr:hypothetical protein ILUMI_23590 [Ignelater luminosus]